MFKHRKIAICCAVSALAMGSTSLLHSQGIVGREVAIPRHLRDGEEFEISISQLIHYGQTLFRADFTTDSFQRFSWNLDHSASDESFGYVVVSNNEIGTIMQHSSPSAVIKCIYLLLAIGAFSSLRGATGAIAISAATDRPTIIAGEPLLIKIILTNSSAEKALIRGDSYGFDRVITRPDGARVAVSTEAPPPDYGYVAQEIAPGAEKTVRFVATEVAQLRRPGVYRITITYAASQISSDVQFVLEPYDEAALRARAEEMASAANDLNEQGSLNENALLAIDRVISRPLLCKLLRSGRQSVSVAQKLAYFGDAQSVNCLIDVLPISGGRQREAVVAALEQLERRISNRSLQRQIDKAVRSQ